MDPSAADPSGQPPATLTLRYCATCDRHHWPSGTGEHPDYHYRDGGVCPGTVQTLTYRLDAGQPEPEMERLRAENSHLRARTHCGCERRCGDDGDIDGPGVCKGLPRMSDPPLIELTVVRRDARSGERLDVPDTTGDNDGL